jgi:hypothetical protein
MFVTFDGDIPRLEDIENFRALKVVVNGSEQPPLTAVGRVDGAYVWLDRAWLEAQGRPLDPVWAQAFAGMLGYAAKSGWVDDGGAIRAHIETTQV